MFTEAQTDDELATYQAKLLLLSERHANGARSLVATQAQDCADALTCLLEEAPLRKRDEVDYLIDRFEALRLSCSN